MVLVAAICMGILIGACWVCIALPFQYLPTTVAIIIDVVLLILLISGVRWGIEKEEMGSKPDD